jgi:3',5'-cyclic AMP phosphodiesterase CpdA
MTLLIAQLSDIHLGFSPIRPEPNEERLIAVLAELAEHRPDAIVLSGDLTERGALEDFRRVRAAVAGMPCPVFPMVGNHDRRAELVAAFPETPLADGFVQYVADLPGLRCIMLDTLVDGRQGGGFCDTRAAWLRARLDEAPELPTLMFAHHPPVPTGVAWMDPAPDADWIRRIRDAVAGHDQIIGLSAGHVHAPSVTGWYGVPVTVAPSVAAGLALSFDPIDPAHADGRAMIVDSAPGYALHRWEGARLTTHFATVRPPVAARYDAKWQALIGQMEVERGDGA